MLWLFVSGAAGALAQVGRQTLENDEGARLKDIALSRASPMIFEFGCSLLPFSLSSVKWYSLIPFRFRLLILISLLYRNGDSS